MNKRTPAEVFHPGEHLLDELNARGWTAEDFAEKIESPVGYVEELLKCNRLITIATAQKIGEALGTSCELWLNLQIAYRKYGKG